MQRRWLQRMRIADFTIGLGADVEGPVDLNPNATYRSSEYKCLSFPHARYSTACENNFRSRDCGTLLQKACFGFYVINPLRMVAPPTYAFEIRMPERALSHLMARRRFHSNIREHPEYRRP